MRAYSRLGVGLAFTLTLLIASLALTFLHGPRPVALAASVWGPANEANCPLITAADPFVGGGTQNFTPNQNLCLPQLAPVGGPMGPVAFIVRGLEPGIRVDEQGTVYVESIRGVPGGVDLWRWYQNA